MTSHVNKLFHCSYIAKKFRKCRTDDNFSLGAASHLCVGLTDISYQ